MWGKLVCAFGVTGGVLTGSAPLAVLCGGALTGLLVYDQAAAAGSVPPMGALLRQALPVAARRALDGAVGEAKALAAQASKPWQAPAAQAARAIAPPAPQLITAPMINRLGASVTIADVADLDNLWVVGPKGSGKTTVLRRLLSLRRGAHIALDPHNEPGKWACAVRGGGRRYDQIAATLDDVVREMDRRYKAMDAGRITEAECKARRRTLVGDEWMSVSDNIPPRPAIKERGEEVEPAYPGAAARMLTVLSEGRKAGICILAASHADTANAMGVTGRKDILKCYDRVIYLGAMATARYAPAGAMTRPAAIYDPERDAWALVDVGGALAVARPDDLRVAVDPALAALLAAPLDAPQPAPRYAPLTADEHQRLAIARELAAEMGKTRAIQTAFPAAKSGPAYQRIAWWFDQKD